MESTTLTSSTGSSTETRPLLTTADSSEEKEPTATFTRSGIIARVRKVIGFPHTRIGIVGSRDFPYEQFVREILSRVLDSSFVIVSGGAKGPDQWAEEEAKAMGLQTCIHRPDWSQGRHAGFQRNAIIVRDSDAILAFWNGTSRGTLDSINKAKALGKIVCVVLPDGRVLSNYGKVTT